MDTYPTVHGKFGKSSTQNAHFWGNMLVPWRLPHKPYISKREAISNDPGWIWKSELSQEKSSRKNTNHIYTTSDPPISEQSEPAVTLLSIAFLHHLGSFIQIQPEQKIDIQAVVWEPFLESRRFWEGKSPHFSGSISEIPADVFFLSFVLYLAEFNGHRFPRKP